MAKKPPKKKARVKITPVKVPNRQGVDRRREVNAQETLRATMAGVEKPPMPALDPMEAARESARVAQEGNLKLCRAVEVLREAMELAMVAEVDNTTGQLVTPKQLREILVTGLDEYSRLTHQSWRRNKIIHTRAGDRDLSPESFV